MLITIEEFSWEVYGFKLLLEE